MQQVGGIGCGFTLVVPGLIMLTLLTQGISKRIDHGSTFPKFHPHDLRAAIRADLSSAQAVFAYIGAATTKSVLISLIILATSTFFVPVRNTASRFDGGLPRADRGQLQPVRFHHRHLGGEFEQLAITFHTLVITPLTFLGGAFYSIDMLPQPWRTVSLFNPVLYLISGFRWSFYGSGDVGVAASLAFVVAFMVLCLVLLWWIFRTGYRLKP